MLDPIGLQAFAIMYGNSNRQISSKFASLVTPVRKIVLRG